MVDIVGGEGRGFVGHESKKTYAWVDKTTRCKTSKHEGWMTRIS